MLERLAKSLVMHVSQLFGNVKASKGLPGVLVAKFLSCLGERVLIIAIGNVAVLLSADGLQHTFLWRVVLLQLHVVFLSSVGRVLLH